MRNVSSKLVQLFLVVAVWNYSYYYFFPFYQGTSEAPFAYFLPKYLLWLLVTVYVVVTRPLAQSSMNPAVVLLLVYAVISSIHFVHFGQYETIEHLNDLANLVFFSTALVLIRPTEATVFFSGLPLHLLIQVIASMFLLVFLDVHLWEERSIVGAFGNANSFGLALNVSIFWLLSRREPLTALKVFLLIVLAGGVLLSLSGSQTGILFLGLFWLGLMQLPRQLFKIALLLAAAIVALIAAWQFEILDINMLMAVADAASRVLEVAGLDIGSNSGAESRSVELRREIHLFAFQFLLNADFVEVLLGNFSNKEYLLFDSQYLMFLVNYGFIGLVMFLLFQTWILLHSFNYSLRSGDWFGFVTLTAYAVTFLFSRVLYYFPVNVIYFLLVIYVSSRARFIPTHRLGATIGKG